LETPTLMQLPITHDQPSPKNLLARTDVIRTYALQNETSCKGGFIQTLGNKGKISKKTRPYDGLGIDCVSPSYFKFIDPRYFAK
jgi:hypothetical protein